MANRMLPFGYRIQNGQVHIEEHEAQVVRMIFRRYAEYPSYERLAEELNGQDVPYTPGKRWNKNMVARILRDERYIDDPAYPQIAAPESFRLARAAKPEVSGTAGCGEITEIRRLARCGLCHGPVRRMRKNYWRCPRCMESPASIKDAHLVLCVNDLLHRLREQPDTAVPSPAPPAGDEAVQCAQDSFDQELDKAEFDEDAARAKALALAAARFGSLGSADYETMRIGYILAHAEQTDGLDTGLLRQTAAAILVYPSGAVGIRLKNGQSLERSET